MCIRDRENDDYRLHIADTLIAGGYKNDLRSLEILVNEGPEDVLRLIKEMGVDFDRDSQHHIALTLEGGHSRRRILHHKDSTGREITEKLLAMAQSKPNISFLAYAQLATLTPAAGGFWAALLVGAIHTAPLSDLSPTAYFILTRVVARVAVPFFFMTSGFFLFGRCTDRRTALAAFLKKTALIYLIAIVLYLPINLSNGYFSGPNLLPRIIRDVLLDGTLYHLWYLPASMVAVSYTHLETTTLLAVTTVLPRLSASIR